MHLDENSFQEKIRELYRLDPYEGLYGEPIIFMPSKAAHAGRKGEEWRQDDYGTFFHKEGKFFKSAMIAAVGAKTRTVYWKQPVLIQEVTQRYDKYACEFEAGEIELPVRAYKGELEAGVTLQAPPGRFAQPQPTVPRKSLSNKGKKFPKPLIALYEGIRTHDHNRQTGQSGVRIALSPHFTNIVWFELQEVETLIDRRYVIDAVSTALMERFLRKYEEYKRTLKEQGFML